ncbi:hypothetical protein MTR_1g079480 [Medicago truncatula]|uniref:Uncharacterized protein n=1 Tax=Medicago truncatula TaxID=3880 RepID=G7I5N3_MEDTR|nr:hypothetical protein MTR_1g079480 [Medicago truncatula]
MFGLMDCNGMEWYGMVRGYVPLFRFLKIGWNGMEHDGIHSIPYHHLSLFFIPPNLGGMQWNGTT